MASWYTINGGESTCEAKLINTNWKPFQQTILSVSGGSARPINDEPSSSSSSSSTSSYNSPLCKLTSLVIYGIHDLQFLPDELKNLTSLKDLYVVSCQELKSLHLTSLQLLSIGGYKKLNMCDDKIHAIAMWQQPLKRLQTLSFFRLPQPVDLPRGLHHLTGLQIRDIGECENLVSLLKWIKSLTSLRTIGFCGCTKLASLPEEITSLISLHTLVIWNCCTLKPRCEREEGKDWPKISHIPALRIY